MFLPSVFFLQTISYIPALLQIYYPLLFIALYSYMYLYVDILLNIVCSVNIMLLISMFPGLTVWHQATN